MIQDPRINSAQRRTLGDITNLPNQKVMLMNHGANQQQQAMSLSSKEYAEKLQKAKCLLSSLKMFMTFSTLFKRILFFIFAGKHETDESPHGEKVWDLWVFCVRWFAANAYCCFCDYSAIIERTGSELQKYRINLQMVQAQNLQLSQTNTRILAVYLNFFEWFIWICDFRQYNVIRSYFFIIVSWQEIRTSKDQVCS